MQHLRTKYISRATLTLISLQQSSFSCQQENVQEMYFCGVIFKLILTPTSFNETWGKSSLKSKLTVETRLIAYVFIFKIDSH